MFIQMKHVFDLTFLWFATACDQKPDPLIDGMVIQIIQIKI